MMNKINPKPFQTEVHARLAIVDIDCDPNKITELLQLEPTEVWRAGDYRFKGTRSNVKHTNSGWELESGIAANRPVNDHIKTLLKRLAPCWSSLKTISSKYYVELALGIRMRGEQRPELHFDAITLQRLTEVNAHIDIDLY